MLAQQERRRRAMAHANGQELMIYTIERGLQNPPAYGDNRFIASTVILKGLKIEIKSKQTTIIGIKIYFSDEPPSYEDALKLPKVEVVTVSEIPIPSQSNLTEAVTCPRCTGNCSCRENGPV